MLVHEVRHHCVQGTLPFTRSPRAGTRIRSEFAQLFVVRLLRVRQRHLATRRSVFAGEEDRVCDFFHRQVANGSQGAPAGRATCELRATVAAHEVSALTLEDRWQDIVKAHGAFEEARQIIVGSRCSCQSWHPLRRWTLGGTSWDGCSSLTAHIFPFLGVTPGQACEENSFPGVEHTVGGFASHELGSSYRRSLVKPQLLSQEVEEGKG